jgi:hypothetical protein
MLDAMSPRIVLPYKDSRLSFFADSGTFDLKQVESVLKDDPFHFLHRKRGNNDHPIDHFAQTQIGLAIDYEKI